MQKEDSLELDLDFTLKTSNALKPIQASKNIGALITKTTCLVLVLIINLIKWFCWIGKKAFFTYGLVKGVKTTKTRCDRTKCI